MTITHSCPLLPTFHHTHQLSFLVGKSPWHLSTLLRQVGLQGRRYLRLNGDDLQERKRAVDGIRVDD